MLPGIVRSVLAAVLTLAVSGCSAAASSTAAPDPTACPQSPVRVAASIGPWGALAAELGGGCAEVTTILGSSSGDPHEYEPTPSDAVALTTAQVVVVNGLGYDAWAQRILGTVDAGSRPAVVEAASVTGAAPEANPHLWYDPAAVGRVATAVSAAMVHAAPAAGDYLRARLSQWQRGLRAYQKEVAALATRVAGRSYGATEGVADYLLTELRLVDATPAGWTAAAAHDSDPSPGDLLDFLSAVSQHRMAVLVVNPQTEGALPDQVRDAAVAASVPVVAMSETLPDPDLTLLGWQRDQLRALAAALDVPMPGGPS